jgi:hypothetical protein
MVISDGGEPMGNQKGTDEAGSPRAHDFSAQVPREMADNRALGCATVISVRRDALPKPEIEEPKANLGGTRASNDIQPGGLKRCQRVQ